VGNAPTQELIYLVIALMVFGVFQYVLSYYNVVLAILAAFTGQSFDVWGGQYIPLLIDAVLAALVVGLIVALMLVIRGRA